MNHPSLDIFYKNIYRQLLLAESYTEIKDLSFIFQACRLKPIDLFVKNKSNKLRLYRWWFDEFGNSLKIIKKRIKIIHGDLLLDLEAPCTDLYHGLNLMQIAKISKLLYIYIENDEDIGEYCLLTFLGIDNYFRSYFIDSREIRAISTLSIDFNRIKYIAKHKEIKYFIKMIPTCQNKQEWLSFLPMPKTLWHDIQEKHNIDLSFLI